MEDEIEGQLEDLQLVEIQELLEEDGHILTDEQIAELARFVQAAGGLDEALELVECLLAEKKAA